MSVQIFVLKMEFFVVVVCWFETKSFCVSLAVLELAGPGWPKTHRDPTFLSPASGKEEGQRLCPAQVVGARWGGHLSLALTPTGLSH